MVTNHTGVSAWGRSRRSSGHATSVLGSWCSPPASTSRRMYRRAAGGWYAAACVGGGQAALTAVAPDMEVQAERGHLRASVGVLLSSRGVDEPQVGVLRAGGVEKVDQGVVPPWVVGGPFFAAAVVEVLLGASRTPSWSLPWSPCKYNEPHVGESTGQCKRQGHGGPEDSLEKQCGGVLRCILLNVSS